MTGSRTRAWLVAAAIFVLGLAVGAAATAAVGVRWARRALQAPANTPVLADRAAIRIGREIVREFDLNPTESAAVHAELRQTALHFRQARVRYVGEISAEARTAAERIAELLPPEKRRAFRELAARRFEKLGLPAAPAADAP